MGKNKDYSIRRICVIFMSTLLVGITLLTVSSMINKGGPVGVEFQVNTYTTSNQLFPSIAMDSAGNFIIVWQSEGQDGDGYGVYAQRFDKNGNPLGLEFLVNTYTTGDQGHPSVEMDSAGNFVIAWDSEGQDGFGLAVIARRYDNNGNPLGPEFQVNSFIAVDQGGPEIAMNSTGHFVIVWESNAQDGDQWGIFAQRYDNNGNPQGGEFQVNTYTTDRQGGPQIAMNTTGHFIITWSSDGQDGDWWGVYAQRYDNNGNPQGGEFQVNTYNTSIQASGGVKIDSQGNFVITWHSYHTGDAGEIFARHYDNNGNPQGTEFQINTHINETQVDPLIEMDSLGNYIIIWQSWGQDGDEWGIYARYYDNRLFYIYDIQVGDITDTTATITWSSTLPANSTVNYGFSSSYGYTFENVTKSRSHTVNLTGLEPGRICHFRVISYNNSVNYSISKDFTFTTKFPINLEPGWNMISVPLNQTDPDLGKVLENISGDYDAVQWYDVGDSVDPWKHNHTSKPSTLNDLTDVDKHMGLWIHITNPLGTTLYVDGTAPEIGYINQITLFTGWNFVGYPSLIERAPDSSGLPVEVDMVMWYNASSGLWERWDPGGSPDTLNLLKPGQGLWIHYTGVSDVWSLEYVN